MLAKPKRDRIAERREATRQEILSAAWALAEQTGIASLTLRDVAERVGMRAPSLYSHFESKNAIYDAMFAQAWQGYLDSVLALEPELSDHPRPAIKQLTRHFYDYATSELARHQLMNQRTVPGFEPTDEAYAPAVQVLDRALATLRRLGVTSRDDFDIWVALVGGLVNQHHANDPGGKRFVRLLDRAVDMWADGVGLPLESLPPSRKARR